MDDITILVTNVKKFVQHCREKNKDLLKYTQSNENEDLRLQKIYSGEYAFGKSFDNTCSEGDNFGEDQKLEFFRNKNYATESRRNAIMQKTEISETGSRDATSVESDNSVKESLTELKKNSSISNVIFPSMSKFNYNQEDSVLSGEKLNDRDGNGQRTHRSDITRDNKEMDQLLKDDLELLKMYNNLKRDSDKLQLANKKNKKKRKKESNTQIKDKNIQDGGKKKKLRSLQSMKSTNTRSFNLKKKKSKNLGNNEEIENMNYVKELEKRIQTLKSKKSFSSVISGISGKRSSIFHIPLKLYSEKFVCFQEGGVNGRLKNNFNNNTPYNIGGMYMNSDPSESERSVLEKLKDAKSGIRKRLKSSKDLKFSFGSGAHINNYKKMINELEKSNKISRKKKKGGNEVFVIINYLLHNFVPKLIGRYEMLIGNVDKQNKVLKQKIKESLDFGDIQYEEIRELKCQLVQENNKNRKLIDTINTLKEKFHYTNELESKNAEYLDETVVLRNRINFLEKVIEDNDYSKQNDELKRIRHDAKILYKNLQRELKLVNLMKVKYVKYKRKKKFSIYRWMHTIHENYKNKEFEIDSIQEASSTFRNGQNKVLPSFYNLEKNTTTNGSDLGEVSKEKILVEETQKEISKKNSDDKQLEKGNSYNKDIYNSCGTDTSDSKRGHTMSLKIEEDSVQDGKESDVRVYNAKRIHNMEGNGSHSDDAANKINKVEKEKTNEMNKEFKSEQLIRKNQSEKKCLITHTIGINTDLCYETFEKLLNKTEKDITTVMKKKDLKYIPKESNKNSSFICKNSSIENQLKKKNTNLQCMYVRSYLNEKNKRKDISQYNPQNINGTTKVVPMEKHLYSDTLKIYNRKYIKLSNIVKLNKKKMSIEEKRKEEIHKEELHKEELHKEELYSALQYYDKITKICTNINCCSCINQKKFSISDEINEKQ